MVPETGPKQDPAYGNVNKGPVFGPHSGPAFWPRIWDPLLSGWEPARRVLRVFFAPAGRRCPPSPLSTQSTARSPRSQRDSATQLAGQWGHDADGSKFPCCALVPGVCGAPPADSRAVRADVRQTSGAPARRNMSSAGRGAPGTAILLPNSQRRHSLTMNFRLPRLDGCTAPLCPHLERAALYRKTAAAAAAGRRFSIDCCEIHVTTSCSHKNFTARARSRT